MGQVNETQRPHPAAETNNHTGGAAMAPRWAAAIGSLLLGLLFAALPGYITRGLGWLPLILEIVLMLPLFLAWLMGRTLPHPTTRILAFILLGVVTLALAGGVILMIITLPDRTQTQAAGLLRTAGLLWLANILVFSLWYWEVDGGGPRKRHQKGHRAADLMFPQQTADFKGGDWAPHFLDYVFVAFTSATALSPTDTYPLTRKAKFLMMIESLLSLVVIILLAARAVNIL
ncbi:MAG TPA: hypothetical protein VKY19_03575 [Ktedonosporobacter sp.]|jgi:hypothetical protein|nr:hypothetical protein [Ktedonosporobacter sp.]